MDLSKSVFEYAIARGELRDGDTYIKKLRNVEKHLKNSSTEEITKQIRSLIDRNSTTGELGTVIKKELLRRIKGSSFRITRDIHGSYIYISPDDIEGETGFLSTDLDSKNLDIVWKSIIREDIKVGHDSKNIVSIRDGLGNIIRNPNIKTTRGKIVYETPTINYDERTSELYIQIMKL